MTIPAQKEIDPVEQAIRHDAASWIEEVLIADIPTSNLLCMSSRASAMLDIDVRLSETEWEGELGTAVIFKLPHGSWARIIIDSRVTDLRDRITMWGHEMGHLYTETTFGTDSSMRERDESIEAFCEWFGQHLALSLALHAVEEAR